MDKVLISNTSMVCIMQPFTVPKESTFRNEQDVMYFGMQLEYHNKVFLRVDTVS